MTYNKTIFTTGAFLSPMKIIDSQGKEFWVWTVSEFVDDSFSSDGEIYNPKEYASTIQELLVAE